MATSYTTNFSFKKPGLSDAGWGQTLNESLDLIDNVISCKNAINVDDFSGSNNLIKIQAAIDYAIANRKIIEFTKVYDISGLGSIKMIKPYPYTGTLYIVGKGGGIKKEDAGYVFENPPSTHYMSDFNISGMYFESLTHETITNVWNLDYFMRINSHDNTYIGIDSVARCDNIEAQSVRFTREVIRGGNGYAFFCRIMIDVTISECLFEERFSGYDYSGGAIANTVSSLNTDDHVNNYNIRIENNVIEGMDLAGVKLGNCISSIIKGNYMEANNGYFDLDTLVDSGTYIYSLDFSSNHIQQTAQQVLDDVPALKIKNILGLNATDYKQNSSLVFSNNRSLGILYEIDSASRINSIGDYSTNNKLCNTSGGLNLLSGTSILPEGVGYIETVMSGIAYGFRKAYAITISATTKQNYAIDITNTYLGNPVTDNSVVTITVSDITNIKVHAYNWVFKSSNISTVNICLENIDTVQHSIFVYINVINLGE